MKTIELLNEGEGIDTEYKQNAKNLKGEDFAAFANSSEGGIIFIGVEEYDDEFGHQKGRAIGCKVGDNEKTSLQNKASQCVPKVEIKIKKENIEGEWIFRIEIPSGTKKPYCSSGGTYKIRKDGLTEALHPTELLNIMLEQEQESFLARFKEASTELQSGMQAIYNATQQTTNAVMYVGNELSKKMGE